MLNVVQRFLSWICLLVFQKRTHFVPLWYRKGYFIMEILHISKSSFLQFICSGKLYPSSHYFKLTIMSLCALFFAWVRPFPGRRVSVSTPLGIHSVNMHGGCVWGFTSFHKETSKHMGPRKHKYIKSEMLIYKLERLFISCLIFIKHVSTSDILTFFSQMIKDRICLDIQPLDKASELTYRLNFSIVSAGLKENIFSSVMGKSTQSTSHWQVPVSKSTWLHKSSVLEIINFLK